MRAGNTPETPSHGVNHGSFALASDESLGRKTATASQLLFAPRLKSSSTHPGDPRRPSSPSSPSSSPQTPMGLCSGSSEPALNGGCSGAFCNSTGGTTPSSPISLPKSPTFPSASVSGSTWQDECSICYENMVDTVIYACGHMCLCHTCGLRLKRMANACCPICRRPIKDIIKTYRST
ncbi:hypothetical protein ACEWY4_017800 [Coilia grayii]|uniref:RING-type domain-containing protein n=1 Tax=Coilia grayii TaxID=363190 RepID=A0ABD1JHX5_9TELE